MSSVLKKRKLKTGIKYSKIKPDYKEMMRECFNNVFTSLQLCSWYVLYAPEYFDWAYEDMIRFSECMDKNNHMHDDLEVYRLDEENLKKETGIDFRVESKKFPYRAKIKMYGKNIAPMDIPIFTEAMDRSVESILFLVVYTLMEDFGVSCEEIKNKFIPYFMQISYEYSAGMTDDHLRRYFSELEGWNIEVERECGKIW